MGFVQKKDDREEVDGVEIIERSDVPEDLPEPEVELIEDEEATEEASTDEEAGQESPEGDAGADGGEDDPASCACGGGDGKGPCPRGKLLIAGFVALLIVVAIGGYFVGRGGFSAKGVSSATLSEGQLDSTVATWSYNGATKSLTAREVIESQLGLDAAKLEDGTYSAPASEAIIAHVRNQILLDEAASRGISVSDEEAADYANLMLGTSDYAVVAERYGVTEDEVDRIVRENALINKLRMQIAPQQEQTAPEAPAEPENGDTAFASKEYADYIIALAGEEWDAEKGTWADANGPMAQALSSSQTFSAESATYTDAQTAFFVAYQAYAESAQGVQKEWNTFANGLFAKADVTLHGVFF
ncbi:MAG: hypothetical protein SOU51_04890 [Collinsella sp.]|nr:hypothetical protein [Collinsella sp.]